MTLDEHKTITEAIEMPKKWQWFPGADWFPPFPHPSHPPAGRWVWIPDPAYGGCDACRESGVCMCVRSHRQIYC